MMGKATQIVFAVGTWLAEDFNEHVKGNAPGVVAIALVLSVLLLWAWWRVLQRRR